MQSSLWQVAAQSAEFSELCSALYEREIANLAQARFASVEQIQSRIKSLPHYIKHTAFAMLNSDSPLELDVQNASWSAKQATKLPYLNQLADYQMCVLAWYQTQSINLGLVVPIALADRIVLDSIDRIDNRESRLRTNAHGWFNINEAISVEQRPLLLKPTKKIMTAACSGHCWHNQHRGNPVMPSLRELLLSCSINWRNFKKPRNTVN